jgi:hypothetical protein
MSSSPQNVRFVHTLRARALHAVVAQTFVFVRVLRACNSRTAALEDGHAIAGARVEGTYLAIWQAEHYFRVFRPVAGATQLPGHAATRVDVPTAPIFASDVNAGGKLVRARRGDVGRFAENLNLSDQSTSIRPLAEDNFAIL